MSTEMLQVKNILKDLPSFAYQISMHPYWLHVATIFHKTNDDHRDNDHNKHDQQLSGRLPLPCGMFKEGVSLLHLQMM